MRLALSSPLLVRNPKTNQYTLNFDPYIVEVIRELEHMCRFGLEVPNFIQIIMFSKKKIFSSHETVKTLVAENDALRSFYYFKCPSELAER